MFVYLITNIINGKRYVGQTFRSLDKRWRGHCVRRSKCLALSRAIKKHGPDNFIVEVLIEVHTKFLADEFEKEYIARYLTRAPNGYNLTDGGEGVVNPTEECRAKMREGALNQRKEDKARGGRTQGLIQGKKNLESGLWNRVTSLGGIASGKSKSISKLSANKKNGDRFGKWSVESGHLASLRTKEHQKAASRVGVHVRCHVNRNIINPNCALCNPIGERNETAAI